MNKPDIKHNRPLRSMWSIYRKCARAPVTCDKCGVEVEPGTVYFWLKLKHSKRVIRCADCEPKRSELAQYQPIKDVLVLQESLEEIPLRDDLTMFGMVVTLRGAVHTLNQLVTSLDLVKSSVELKWATRIQTWKRRMTDLANDIESLDCNVSAYEVYYDMVQPVVNSMDL